MVRQYFDFTHTTCMMVVSPIWKASQDRIIFRRKINLCVPKEIENHGKHYVFAIVLESQLKIATGINCASQLKNYSESLFLVNRIGFQSKLLYEM